MNSFPKNDLIGFTPDIRPPERTTLLSSCYKALARLLILASVPASLVWYPLLDLPDFGRFTASDVILIVLWSLALPYYATRKRRSPMREQTFLILVLATLPGMLAALGAVDSEGARGPLIEFAGHMKRFGLAAVLPLAMNCFSSARLYLWSSIVLFICILAMDLFSLLPDLRIFMMIESLEVQPTTLGTRAMGMISNPNDSAYIAICAMAGVISIIRSQERQGFWLTLLIRSTITGSLVIVVLSTSRSGVLALLIGAFYYITVSRLSIMKKSLIIVLFVLGGAISLSYSEEFQQRMQSAFSQGLGEQNVESRLQAQYVAFLAALENPMGVGFLNFPQATAYLSGDMVFSAVEGSDSIYFDTLLGAGFLGLAALLLLYSTCWKYVCISVPRPTEASMMLKAGCIAVSVFGLATISPASVFVSPVAFFMVGSSVLLGIKRRQPISIKGENR